MARKRISRPTIQRWSDWKGREVSGRIADIRENDMGKLLDIRTADGILTFGLTTVLESLVGNVPKGTPIWVTCTGKSRNKSGQEYYGFDVELDLPEEPSEPGAAETSKVHGNTPAHAVPGADTDIPF